MAEPPYVTRDELRAELAEFHKDWAGMRQEWGELRGELRAEFALMRKDMADLRADLAFRLPVWAFIGGLAGGLIAAAAKIFQ